MQKLLTAYKRVGHRKKGRLHPHNSKGPGAQNTRAFSLIPTTN